MKNDYSRSARARDAAALLPVLGVFLFMPPVITLFVAKLHIAGVPLIVAYLFGVWLALIACAALLARRLRERPARTRPAESAEPPA
ncbi:MAG TPA: hypothetical protein VF203_08180 [Burkholderiales bacterium]